MTSAYGHPPWSAALQTNNGHSAAWTPSAPAAVARFKPVASLKNRLLTHLVVWGARFWMQRMNTLVTVKEAQLTLARDSDRGRLTFSNHISLFDDPLLTACLSDANWSRARQIAADAQNFFGTPLLAAVFHAGKCVPIVRGAGVQQPGMDFLNAGTRRRALRTETR